MATMSKPWESDGQSSVPSPNASPSRLASLHHQSHSGPVQPV